MSLLWHIKENYSRDTKFQFLRNDIICKSQNTLKIRGVIFPVENNGNDFSPSFPLRIYLRKLEILSSSGFEMCVYICVYVHTYTHVSLYVYVFLYIHIYIHIQGVYNDIHIHVHISFSRLSRPFASFRPQTVSPKEAEPSP